MSLILISIFKTLIFIGIKWETHIPEANLEPWYILLPQEYTPKRSTFVSHPHWRQSYESGDSPLLSLLVTAHNNIFPQAAASQSVSHLSDGVAGLCADGEWKRKCQMVKGALRGQRRGYVSSDSELSGEPSGGKTANNKAPQTTPLPPSPSLPSTSEAEHTQLRPRSGGTQMPLFLKVLTPPTGETKGIIR